MTCFESAMEHGVSHYENTISLSRFHADILSSRCDTNSQFVDASDHKLSDFSLLCKDDVRSLLSKSTKKIRCPRGCRRSTLIPCCHPWHKSLICLLLREFSPSFLARQSYHQLSKKWLWTLTNYRITDLFQILLTFLNSLRRLLPNKSLIICLCIA